jgi:phage-related baseplate assembly protein
MAAAKASLQKYIASQTRLGRDIRRSAIYAALHVEGVQRVELASPLEMWCWIRRRRHPVRNGA